jgi:hypothetical protein
MKILEEKIDRWIDREEGRRAGATDKAERG